MSTIEHIWVIMCSIVDIAVCAIYTYIYIEIEEREVEKLYLEKQYVGRLGSADARPATAGR